MAGQVFDLAVVGGGAGIAQEAADQAGHVALGRPSQYRHREGAVVDLGAPARASCRLRQTPNRAIRTAGST